MGVKWGFFGFFRCVEVRGERREEGGGVRKERGEMRWMTLLATSAWPYSAGTLEGRTAYTLMCGPLFWSMNQMLDPASLRFELKSLTLVAAEADPLSEARPDTATPLLLNLPVCS